MNKHWFTCRISYRKLDESGHEVKAVSSYLVDAYSYTEAEARIIHLMNQEINGTFEVVNITKNNFAEVIDADECEMWFKVKVALISFDENTGKEKQSNQYFLMCADDVQDAFIRTEEYMKGSVSGFVIPSITYTKIEEVFRETPDEKEEMNLRDRGFVPMSESALGAAAMASAMMGAMPGAAAASEETAVVEEESASQDEAADEYAEMDAATEDSNEESSVSYEDED